MVTIKVKCCVQENDDFKASSAYPQVQVQVKSRHHSLYDKNPWISWEEEQSDLSEDLHDGDGGALAEDESSAEQGHTSPNCEDDSGEDRVPRKH